MMRAGKDVRSTLETRLGLLLLIVYCCYLHYQIYLLQTQVSPRHDVLANSADPSSITTTVAKLLNPYLSIPSPAPKTAVPLTEEQEKAVAAQRSIYGGKNDPLHLGGFTQRDNGTICPNVWNYMLSEWAVKSVLDLGCGKGFSTKYFMDRGAKVLCVEGSKDAIRNSLLPKDVIVEHDLTLGPYWPSETFDVLWSTELLEHVSCQYMDNYMPMMKKAALVMITRSGWGGWHHVEIHDAMWWIARFEARGLAYSEELTSMIRTQLIPYRYGGQELSNMMVFINPSVASLPQHQHLIGGHGCYSVIDNKDGGIPCVGVDALPKAFTSLLECKKKMLSDDVRDLEKQEWECFNSKG